MLSLFLLNDRCRSKSVEIETTLDAVLPAGEAALRMPVMKEPCLLSVVLAVLKVKFVLAVLKVKF